MANRKWQTAKFAGADGDGSVGPKTGPKNWSQNVDAATASAHTRRVKRHAPAGKNEPRYNMSTVWNAVTYDSERRRLVPCFDEFYGSAAGLVARCFPSSPRILDLGAGTGILSAAIVDRVAGGRITLLDASADMLQRASNRLAACHPEIIVQPLTAELPSGPFDAIVSALAIHHLSDEEKRALYGRIFSVLSPGGIFINAEQVVGSSSKLQGLFEAVHLDAARKLGSSDVEIAGAIQRMSYDRCATAADQITWLEQAGFEDVECFFRSFRFAVFGGWRPQ